MSEQKPVPTFGKFTTTPEEEIARLEIEIKDLHERIDFKKNRMAQLKGLIPLPACTICGSADNVRAAKKWLLGHDINICSCCFSVWYDEALTETDAIKQRSLQIQAQASARQGQKSS